MLMLLMALAHAWDVTEGPFIPTDAPVTGVMMVRVNELSLVVAGTQEHTTLYTRGGHLVARVDVGMTDYVLVDADADDSKELVLCGPQGVVVLEPLDFTSWTASTARCDDIEAVVDRRYGPTVAIAGDYVRLYQPTIRGLEDVALISNAVGRVHLAASGERWAWADEGTARVVIRGQTDTQWVVSETIGDLISGPTGIAWSLPGAGVVEDEHGHRWSIGGAPTTLRTVDLDRDGNTDLFALHPSLSAVSVTSGLDQRTEFLRLDPGAVVLHDRDVNDDGCADAVVGFSEPPGVRILNTETCSRVPVVAPDDDRPTSTGRQRLLGIGVPPFEGASNLRPRELRGRQELLFGTGWGVGGALGDTFIQIPFFPILSAGLRFGGPVVEGYVGGDSAALFFWATDETRGIHLANLTVGMTVGSPRLRIGPHVTGGIWNVGYGLRALWTPWEDGWDQVSGVELRLTHMYPRTGEVMLMYVWSRPDRRRLSDGDMPLGWAAVMDDGHRTANARPRATTFDPHPGYRRMALGLGAAVGASSSQSDWDWLAPSYDFVWRASPVLSVTYDAGNRGFGWMIGAESAPLFAHRGGSGRDHHHLASFTAGLMAGGKNVRVGPIGTAGIWVLGAGGRGVVQVHRQRSGVTHAIEVRGQALLPEVRGVEGMVLWTVGMDPRK